MWDSFGYWTSYEEGNVNNFWANGHSQFPQMIKNESFRRKQNTGMDETYGRNRVLERMGLIKEYRLLERMGLMEVNILLERMGLIEEKRILEKMRHMEEKKILGRIRQV